MSKSMKRNFMLMITLSLSLVIGLTGYFSFKPKDIINAYTNNITVEYGDFIEAFDKATNTKIVKDDPNKKTVTDDTFVLLPTDNSNAIKVHFELNNKEDEIVSLSTSLTINNVPVDTEQNMEVEKDQSTFTQYIHYDSQLKENPTDKLSDITYTGSSLQGEYVYTFIYTSNLTDTRQTETVRFYVGFESQYLNSTSVCNVADTTEPKLYNTEKIFRYKDSNDNNATSRTGTEFSNESDKKEYNYFHFSNNSIVDYDASNSNAKKDVNNQSGLLFPTYTYDATRYNLSWTYALNGITSYYKTVFSSNGGNGKLDIYKSDSNESLGEIDYSFGNITCNAVNRDNISNNTSQNNKYKYNHYYVNISFDQVGEYQFSMQPTIATSENVYKVIDTVIADTDELYNVSADKYYVFGNVELRIFGYELFYTNYNGGDDVNQFITRDTDNNLITADVTNKVIKDGDTYRFGTINLNSNTTYNDVKDIFNPNIVTNQAPIMFSKYAAQMSMQNDSITSKSFCLYFPTTNTKEGLTNITNSTKFSKNGYYIITTIYTYIHYQAYENRSMVSKNSTEFYQTFAFQIKNTEPTVTITTDDNNAFYSNEITNQNISFKWETTSNLFDVIPSLEVYAKVNGASEYAQVTNNSYYVEQNASDINSVILKAQRNLYIDYKVELQYGPNKSTKVIYAFTTDTLPISSSVYNVETNDENKFIQSNRVAEEDNFAIVNQNFYLNVNDNKNKKDSKATISVTYDYYSLVLDNDLKNKTYSNDLTYVYNGYKIDLNSKSTYNYSIPTDLQNNVFNGNNASSVLTNPGLYVFSIKDTAGNTATKTVLFENTKPILLIDEDLTDNTSNYKILENSRPIYLQSVNIAYGRYKTIKVENYNPKFNFGSTNFISTSNDSMFIFGNQLKITSNNDLTNPVYFNYGCTLKMEKSEDEATYTIYITSNGITSNKTEITLSSDNSLLFMTPSLSNTNNQINIASRIDEFNYTNSNYIQFSWQNDLGGDYEILSITLNYHPLTYDINSKYYPYSENSTATTDLLTSKTTGIRKSSKNSTDQTECETSIMFNAPGMYVIDRVYKSEPNGNSVDTKERRYIYFLDTNEIFKEIPLSNNSSVNLGELLQIFVGSQIENKPNYQIQLDYKNFLLKGNNVSLFETSKLPVTLHIADGDLLSYYKYAQQGVTNSKNVTNQNDNIFNNINSTHAKGSFFDKISKAFKLNILLDDRQITSSNNVTALTNGNHIVSIKHPDLYSVDNDGIYDNWNKNSSVEWNLKYSITLDSPNADFIKSTSNNNYRVLEDSPYINYTEGVMLAWNNPISEYTAEIDPSKITITVNGQRINFDPSSITSNNYYDNVIDMESLLSPYPTGDLLVNIHLEYYGNQNYETYVSTKTLYIDRTKPNLNYEILKQEDTFLTNGQKQTFDDYNSSISFDNYSFNVDNLFNIKTSADPTNTRKIYFRHYDKFNSSLNSSNYVNYQSIANSDDRYDNNDIIRLKFDADYVDSNQTKIYNEINIPSSNTYNLYSYLANNSQYRYGYFEIIEQDYAGNQSIFTIYLPNYEQDNDDNLFEDRLVFIDENGNILPNEINSTSMPNFTIEYENSGDGVNKRFLTLSILRDNNFVESYKISPIALDGYISLDEAIELMKQTVKDVDVINGTKYEFILSYTASSLNAPKQVSSSIVFNYPSEEINLICERATNNNTKILQVSWINNASTYITNLSIYTIDISGNKVLKTIDDFNQTIGSLIDSDGNILTPTYRFNVEAGASFIFEITDNFNRTYTQNHIVDLLETKEFVFSNNYIVDNGIYYTSGQVTVNYQPKLYAIRLYNLLSQTPDIALTSKDIDDLGIKYLTNTSTGITTYTLFNQNKQFRLRIEITNLDATNILENMSIEYVNALATIQLRLGADIIFDTDQNVSSPLNSTLNTPTLYILNQDLPDTIKTKVYATVTDKDGVVTNLGEIQNATTLNYYGKYVLTIRNDLGLEKTFAFEVRDSQASDFTVYTTTGKILTASSVKYERGDIKMDWFFSTEEYNIEYSGRFATMEQDYVGDDGNTIVYKLSTQNIDNDPTKVKTKYLAVTRVNSSSNFITDANFTFNSTKLTTTSNNIKLMDKQVTIKVEKPYNTYEGNLIMVNYSFNGSELINIPFESITQFNLVDAGIYVFYFTDVAGNTQVFNNTRYLTVSLFNKVIINVNDGQQINNAVYNDRVSVHIVNYQDYIYEGQSSLRTVILKDGKDYSLSSRNGTYYFTEYGVYSISFNGIMNGRTLENSLMFTILNENQAYVAYEYIGNSGYEITQITRDGEDVYEEIRKAMSKLSFEDDLLLTSLPTIVLSGSSLPNHIGGNGKYEITVTARRLYNNIDFNFTFNIWINSGEEVYILSSIEAGSSTTSPIELRINTSQIFEKIGTCNIVINDRTWLHIDASGVVSDLIGDSSGITKVQTSDTKAYSIYRLTQTGTYNIKIQTVSGNNTLMSFTVTKTEPLNGTAILVIVIVVIVVAGIITLFLLLRKKMRVK